LRTTGSLFNFAELSDHKLWANCLKEKLIDQELHFQKANGAFWKSETLSLNPFLKKKIRL